MSKLMITDLLPSTRLTSPRLKFASLESELQTKTDEVRRLQDQTYSLERQITDLERDNYSLRSSNERYRNRLLDLEWRARYPAAFVTRPFFR